MSNPRVALVKCASYSENLESSIEEMLDHIGGISSFIQPGQTVLIKPNMLTDRIPDRAVTTHPEIIRAIIRLVKKAQAFPSVGDSPASASKLERVWETTGIKNVCQEENVPLINMEKAGSTTITSASNSFNVSKPVLDSDLIINVPKLKTHVLTTLTAAVKNMYGIIPGFHKAALHKTHPDQRTFGKLIKEIYETIPPQINILDGIVGMQGNGPSNGTPIQLGFLAASANAAALDLTMCKILGIKPKAVPYLPLLIKSDQPIDILGADPNELKPISFKLPNTMFARLIPRWLVKLLSPYIWFRPNIADNCIGCGLCVTACPVKALSLHKNEDGQKAVLEPEKCIECCCCHEICPENAITMQQSPFLAFFNR